MNPSFERVAAYTRIGHKYQILELYEGAMAYLLDLFYTSGWKYGSLDHPMPEGFEEAHAIGVVNIARLTEEQRLLPVSLTLCCRLGEPLVKGFHYSDGEAENLSPSDLALCCKHRDALVKTTLNVVLGTIIPFIPSRCPGKNPGTCTSSMVKLLSLIPTCSERLSNPVPFLPLGEYFPQSTMVTELGKLCDACRKALMERWDERRQNAWSCLPTTFGLDITNWGTLQKK